MMWWDAVVDVVMGQSERRAAEEKLAAELERARARYIRGMDRPDYDTIRRTRSVDLRDVAAVRRWRRRREAVQ